ncbi:trimeric intracellular cation channel family protein [Balneatrix alpica]|uniref:trimeric intracellular cation channel family protein n=1 Tax=Balneatrix alpica TaxID=75684 RepID=UPI002738E6B5|nr:trimeric intracellular cation channel family protein [Balneatrix alpica]
MTAAAVISFLDHFGIIVFAVAGALRGCQKGLDIFGVLVFAIVTATGGGTLRDILMGDLPVTWMRDNTYLWLAIVSGAFTFFYAGRGPIPLRALTVADAVGLAVFTVLGADKALEAGMAPVIVVVMAVMTGCVGGIIRDVLAGEIPLIFHKEIYATAAIAGALVYVGLTHAGISGWWVPWLAMAVVLGLRLAAILFDLRLPRFLSMPAYQEETK